MVCLYFLRSAMLFSMLYHLMFLPLGMHEFPILRVHNNTCIYYICLTLAKHLASNLKEGGFVLAQSIRVAGAALSLWWQELATRFEHIPQEQSVEILGQRWGLSVIVNGCL